MTTHPGWFHRTGHGSGHLHWVPAGSTEPATQTDIAPRPDAQSRNGAPTGPCPVSEVNGRRPTGLDDFLGVTSFTVIRGDLAYRVFGTGEPGTGLVRFRQQDLDRAGRTLRTWTITTTNGDAGITAEPDPTAEQRPRAVHP